MTTAVTFAPLQVKAAREIAEVTWEIEIDDIQPIRCLLWVR